MPDSLRQLPDQSTAEERRPLPHGGELVVNIVAQPSPTAESAGRALWRELLRVEPTSADTPAAESGAG